MSEYNFLDVKSRVSGSIDISVLDDSNNTSGILLERIEPGVYQLNITASCDWLIETEDGTHWTAHKKYIWDCR